MNFSLLNRLVSESKLGKLQISELAGISRTTLDNALNGSDIKVSTIENLAKVLGVSTSIFWADESEIRHEDKDFYEKEIQRLQSLLDKQKRSTKVVVELDVDDDEFIKMGLKDKVIQVLSK
ncbi:helix-turn-helix domain-containing protein [Paraprevotella clara]|jgi:transcriptional regulator with XRE-family HTH domain|uniref:helix-turn-helix domain-containing protein n=1 Tax=Paraprevotella clara TaxID=454154 RepID=UPI00241EC501|nr:helix-turn-helix transcriptional regulator [Paraprevotella clara]MBD9176733.1 XRE family transcriptional regulator [Paraprevotella clara]